MAAIERTVPGLPVDHAGMLHAGRRVLVGAGRCLGLVVAIGLGARVHGYFPGSGIDMSWRTVLNIAAAEHLDFGSDALFTYGPLGFIDAPLAVGPGQLVFGILFAIVAVGVLWLALELAGRRVLPWPVSTLVATIIAVVLASYSNPALELLIAAPVFAFLALHGQLGRAADWVPGVLGGLSALLLLTKFSDGVFAGAIAVLTAAGSLRAPWRRLAETVLAFLGVGLIFWTVAGQSLADLPRWLAGSVQIALGYADAMASENLNFALTYSLATMLAVVVLWLAQRYGRGIAFRQRIAVVLIALVALYGGFKEGFIRHAPLHQAAYFSACVLLLAGLATAVRRRWLVVPFLVVALLFSVTSVSWLNPVPAQRQWSETVRIMTNAHYRDAGLNRDAASLRKRYDIPQLMLSRIGPDPVAIDPWEETAAWAYGLNYHPEPVFQSYSAYTAALDRMNAKAILDDPRDQWVLRQPRNFGIRNQLWTSPRYTLALACHYAVDNISRYWMLLHKAMNRCGPTRTLSTVSVHTGQSIAVPAARPGEILVAHFTPRPDGLAADALHLLWKNLHHLYITTDGAKHMIARDLASGPLILSMPSTLRWPDPYQTGAPYHQLEFSESGRLRFEAIPVS